MTITCVTTKSIGALLSWFVIVEGQVRGGVLGCDCGVWLVPLKSYPLPSLPSPL